MDYSTGNWMSQPGGKILVIGIISCQTLGNSWIDPHYWHHGSKSWPPNNHLLWARSDDNFTTLHEWHGDASSPLGVSS